MVDDYFDTPLEHNGRPARISNYITDALTDAALRFVEAHQDQPFFLFLSYNAPHVPNQVPLKYEQEYTGKGLPPHLAKVYGMITCLDDGIESPQETSVTNSWSRRPRRRTCGELRESVSWISNRGKPLLMSESSPNREQA